MKFIFAIILFLVPSICFASGRVQGSVYWFGKLKPGVAIEATNSMVSFIDVTDQSGSFNFVLPDGIWTIIAPGPWASEPTDEITIRVVDGIPHVLLFEFW